MSLPNETQIETLLQNQGVGSVGEGHIDPTGTYPSSNYYNSTSISYQATGGQRHELNMGGGVEGVPVNTTPPVRSQYPFNQVNRTQSGHSIEMDDTPGAERVLIRHNSGAGIELNNDGSVRISSVGNTTQRVQGGLTIIVDGDANLMYTGNVNQTVRGDYQLNVHGNHNINVKGSRTSNITGADRRNVTGAAGDIVGGGLSVTSTKQATMTYLGGLSTNTKGILSMNVDGDANYVASGSTAITSQTNLLIATESGIISSTSLAIQAASGNWGGENVVIGSKGALFSEGVTAPTFHGDLDGTADIAATSLHQSYADGSGTGYSPSVGSRGSITDTATPSGITVPSAASQSTGLNSTANGIRRVLIDVGNYLMNFIDRTEAYGGVSSGPVNLAGARSRLRDPANRSNSAFVGQLLGDQVICPDYNNPAPTGIGRIVKGGDTTAADGGRPVVDAPNPRTAYRASFSEVTLIPEKQYNPYFNSPITSRTALEQGISCATFLGSDDPSTFDHIRDPLQRTSIARYWYLQSQFIKSVSTNKGEFENYTLRVVEGLYRPGPGEKVTPGSINDLKMQGRAVVFQLVNEAGISSPTKTFDLAVYWKDTMYYDKLILSYDTFNCMINTSLIVILPVLTPTWEGKYQRLISTEYNNTQLANGELVECLPVATSQSGISVTPLQTDGQTYGINLGSSELGAPVFERSRAHPQTVSTAPAQMQSLLANEYAAMQSYYGGALRINDALPHPRSSRTTPSNGGGSMHWYGKAIDISTANMSNDEKQRLVAAACKAGFTGFGFGVNILHIDIGSPRHWAYGNTTFGGKIVTDNRPGVDSWSNFLTQNRIPR